MAEDNLSAQELVNIINNVDRRYEHAGKQYILIIYQQDVTRPCSLLVSDCQQAVWSKFLDLHFFHRVKRDLNLNSPLSLLAKHYVESLQKTSRLQKIRTTLKLHIELQIGEGLVMGCQTQVQGRVHFNSPDQFKKTICRFMLGMWSVKSGQILAIQGQHQKKEKQREEATRKQEEKVRPKDQPQKNGRKGKMVSGNLMNPQMKRRRRGGAKLGIRHEQDEIEAQTLERYPFHNR